MTDSSFESREDKLSKAAAQLMPRPVLASPLRDLGPILESWRLKYLAAKGQKAELLRIQISSQPPNEEARVTEFGRTQLGQRLSGEKVAQVRLILGKRRLIACFS